MDIRVIGNLPAHWGSMGSFLGAAVFPVGLILVILAGGELITGNMMSVSMAYYAKKINLALLLKIAGYAAWGDFARNMVPTFIGNLIGGGIFVGLVYYLAFHNKRNQDRVLKKVS